MITTILLAALGLGHCEYQEGYCWSAAQLGTACATYMGGPGVPPGKGVTYIDSVRTYFFYADDCPQNQNWCVHSDVYENLAFACVVPDQWEYTCFVLDRRVVGIWQYDADGDNDIDLADFALVQNEEWTP